MHMCMCIAAPARILHVHVHVRAHVCYMCMGHVRLLAHAPQAVPDVQDRPGAKDLRTLLEAAPADHRGVRFQAVTFRYAPGSAGLSVTEHTHLRARARARVPEMGAHISLLNHAHSALYQGYIYPRRPGCLVAQLCNPTGRQVESNCAASWHTNSRISTSGIPIAVIGRSDLHMWEADIRITTPSNHEHDMCMHMHMWSVD